MTDLTPPPVLVEDLRRLTASELSRPARMGYVGLLLAASAMTVIVIALLITEPSLPLRTSVALAGVAVIGLSWVAFALWVLTHKRVLLGRHHVMAGRLAVGFSSVFCLGALAVGYATSSKSAFTAGAMGVVMVVIAATMLTRARRRVEQLSKRRDELERQLGGRLQ